MAEEWGGRRELLVKWAGYELEMDSSWIGEERLQAQVGAGSCVWGVCVWGGVRAVLRRPVSALHAPPPVAPH